MNEPLTVMPGRAGDGPPGVTVSKKAPEPQLPVRQRAEDIQSEPAHLHERLAGGLVMVVLVTLPAQLDESNAAEISAGLAAAAKSHPAVLIADMSRTRSCDWAGARVLARAFSQATTGGTELRLVTASAAVRRVISLNGLDRLMPIFEDVRSASAVPAAG